MMPDLDPPWLIGKLICNRCDGTSGELLFAQGSITVICPQCGGETDAPKEWHGYPSNVCSRCNEPLESPEKAAPHRCAHLGFISGSAAY
jgi:predicted RNA-binding Zn-ribbon protein involved in translation (DUF1610 family)